MKKIKDNLKEIGIVKCIIILFLLFMGIYMTLSLFSVSDMLESIEDNIYKENNLIDSSNKKENLENKIDFFDFKIVKKDSGVGLGAGYLILILAVIIGIIILKRYKKYKKEVSAACIPQENLNEFEEVYNKLCFENKISLETARNKEIIKKVAYGIIIITVIILFIKNPVFTPLIFFTIIIFVILKATMKNSKANIKFVTDFKLNIVKPIIQLALPEAIYTPKDGISRSKYDEVDWDYYDTFESEDLIEGKIKLDGYNNYETNFVMSEVHTTYETKDSDGDTHTYTSFLGLVSYINLPKNIGCDIHIIRGKGNKRTKLNLDMAEFEKLYDVETDDKIKATQILTSDVMLDIVELADKNKVDFRVDIQKDKLYFKFYIGQMFEPKIFNKRMQKITLQKYYNVVRMCVKISKEICEIILKANI